MQNRFVKNVIHPNLNFSKTKEAYQDQAIDLQTLTLTAKQLCDLELLLNNGFAPLTQFMNEADYLSVLQTSRLQNGKLWPIPIMLDVDELFLENINIGDEIALQDQEGLLIAVMILEEYFPAQKKNEAISVFGTEDDKHPGVHYLNYQTKDFYISGKLLKISMPWHYDFSHLRHSPEDLKNKFCKLDWDRVVAFQTRNPMHRAHQELTFRAAEKTKAKILLHPVVGMTKPGDIEYFNRVRCYEHILKCYSPNQVMLSLLPLAMRMAGPKEAVWHALIRKNYGCTHFIVGRDHAGPGKNTKGENFYSPYAAQELALSHQAEMGIEIVTFEEMVYSKKYKKYFVINEFPNDDTPSTISGSQVREKLSNGEEIPEWFSSPNVIAELRTIYPPKAKQGITIFFTGLPSSGKSTLANALAIKLRELSSRKITILDGDIIRTHLSKGLGFDKQDRETNVTRVGFVASEITKHGGIAICALVSPYENSRAMVKEMVSANGGYFEIYISTPLRICEDRDRKGLYKKARAGLITQFTGISDPYEVPTHADVVLDTSQIPPADGINTIITKLKSLGYLYG